MCSLLSNSGLRKLMRFPITPSNPGPCSLYLCMLLLSCGDIESHPCPSYYPCAYCQLNVDWNCSGVCCDNCSVWLHRSCADLSTSAYNKLSNISTSWRCYRCNITNRSGSYFHSYDLEIFNAFDILSRLQSNSDIFFSLPLLVSAQVSAARRSLIPTERIILRTSNLKLLDWAHQVTLQREAHGQQKAAGLMSIRPVAPRPRTQTTGVLSQ